MTPIALCKPIALCVVMCAVVLAPSVRAQPAAPPAVREIRVDERVGEQVALDPEFRTAQGAEVALRDYVGDGKPVLLVLAYTRCAMLCSLVLRGVTDALKRIDSQPGEDFRVVTISIDPREGPHEASRKQAVVLEELGYPGQVERWPFLVGDEPAIRAVADSLGFGYAWDERTEQYAHPAVVFVLTPDGVISRYVYGIMFGGPQIETALLEAQAGHTRASSATSGGILDCFRFAAVLSKYGPAIQRMFQIGALVILGAIVSLLVYLFRRERGKS